MESRSGVDAEMLFAGVGVTYDDFLMLPGYIDFALGDVSLETKLTREITIKIPVVSSPMDTVTESKMAIQMALLGGIGIVHYNNSVEEQAEEVRKTKKFENGFIVDPIVLSPDHRISDIDSMKDKYGFSGVPITEDGTLGSKLVGIVTRRDVDFETDRSLSLREVMTADLVTAPVGITLAEGNRILKESKKGKLPIVDGEGRLRSLMSRADLRKNQDFPLASKDSSKQLLAGAAVGTKPEDRERLEALVDAGVNVVVFDSSQGNSAFQIEMIRWAKQEYPDLLIVSGGVHATLAPEQVITNGAIDVVCVGEGEYTLLELASRLEAGRDYVNVPGTWARRNGQIVRNPLRHLVEDLDELPFADREVFDFEEMLRENDGWVDMMSGRGCPYDCSYCCNPGLRKRYRGLGKYVRFRRVSHVMAEIEAIARRYEIKTINFQDDTFTVDRDWSLEFCRDYASRYEYPFWINTRVEKIDEEVVRALADAGCKGVRIGIESGNEQLRNEILKRRMSNEEITRAFRLLREYGLDTYSCNMLGLPGETLGMIRETIGLNRQLEPTEFQFSVFYPYPMTELYDRTVGKGMLRPGESLSSYYEGHSILNLPTLTPDELAQGHEGFEALKRELALKRRSPWKYRVYRILSLFTGGGVGHAQALVRRIRRVILG